jgi:hypothetical protein
MVEDLLPALRQVLRITVDVEPTVIATELATVPKFANETVLEGAPRLNTILDESLGITRVLGRPCMADEK